MGRQKSQTKENSGKRRQALLKRLEMLIVCRDERGGYILGWRKNEIAAATGCILVINGANVIKISDAKYLTYKFPEKS